MDTAAPGRRSDTVKTPRRASSRSRAPSENHNPNLPSVCSPSPHKPRKPVQQSPAAPPPPPPGRKFIVVKRNSNKGEEGTLQDRRQAAYDLLRASQDGFFAAQAKEQVVQSPVKDVVEELLQGDVSPDTSEVGGTAKVRKIRSKMMEEAMSSLPEQGCGRVIHLVKAFESILAISKSGGEGDQGEGSGNGENWALPGMGLPPRAVTTVDSYSSSAELFIPQADLQSLRKSSDSCGGRRSRRNSSDSCGSRNKKLGVTHQCPFKLRTELRGRLKEEQFLKKVKEMLMEEEKRRIPQAQGLPWTTDEPECLVKPFIKEPTEPEDIVLHSDVRAVERAEFDNYVAERLALAEQKKLERERQQKLEEEEEIKKMRKELVPKAQPMPFFDRPFVPRRSDKPRTIPREPRFHCFRSHKPCISDHNETAKESRISGSFRF